MLRFSPNRGASSLVLNAMVRGQTGAAATVTAGMATAVQAGGSPTVSNSGSSSAAVFNFGVPRGADSGMRYAFETSTTMAAPASGGLRLNNAAIASVTAIAVNATNSDGLDVSDYVATWDDSTSSTKGHVVVRKEGSGAVEGIYTITSVVDNTTWLQINVSYSSGGGTLSAADPVYLTQDRTGDAGSGTISGLSANQIPVASGAAAIGSGITLTDGQIIVGQTGSAPLAKTATGDVTITAAGVTAIGATKVTNAMLAGSIDLTSKVTGILPPANGGTGVANSKNLTVSNSLTLAGTDSTTMTFPPATAFVGYLNIPQNSQSAAYTTVLADSGKHILHPSGDASTRTFTIDSNANVAYPIGTALMFVNQTTQTVTIAITTDTMTLVNTTSTGSRSLAQNGMATALKLGTATWIISGAGLT